MPAHIMSQHVYSNSKYLLNIDLIVCFVHTCSINSVTVWEER